MTKMKVQNLVQKNHKFGGNLNESNFQIYHLKKGIIYLRNFAMKCFFFVKSAKIHSQVSNHKKKILAKLVNQFCSPLYSNLLPFFIKLHIMIPNFIFSSTMNISFCKKNEKINSYSLS